MIIKMLRMDDGLVASACRAEHEEKTITCVFLLSQKPSPAVVGVLPLWVCFPFAIIQNMNVLCDILG